LFLTMISSHDNQNKNKHYRLNNMGNLLIVGLKIEIVWNFMYNKKCCKGFHPLLVSLSNG